jgi:hypothetical protein
VLVNNVENDMRTQDLELENEINEEFHSRDDNNSQASEYVEDTMIEGEDDEDAVAADGNEVSSSSQLDVSRLNILEMEHGRVDLETRNQQFLRQSWAHLAEDVDAENSLLKGLDKNPVEDDGFQVVKAKSKSPKKKASTVSSYSTRNKAGKQKPFK